MSRASSLDWYRFLDVSTAEDAAGEMRRHVVRLDAVLEEVRLATKPLIDGPDPRVSEIAWTAWASLTDLIDQLEAASSRFWETQPEGV